MRNTQYIKLPLKKDLYGKAEYSNCINPTYNLYDYPNGQILPYKSHKLLFV